ncbi:Hep/Hag repeat protein, partial [Dialister micraerophilus UPII 345-E]
MIKRKKINRNKVKSGMSRRKKILLSAMIASSLLFADGTYVYADGGQQFHGISVNVDGAGGEPGNNYNNDGAGYWSVAIGMRASSRAGYGTAVGPFAKADALGSNATGFYAQALGEYSAAYGAGAKAINGLGVAFGQGAVVSFGKPLKEEEYNTLPESYKKLFTAVRTEEAKTVYYQTKILLQDGSTQDQKICSVAIGASAAARDNNAVAIGYRSSADEMGAVGIGAFTEAKGKQGLALGYVAKAIGDFSTAVGQWSQANGDHAVAIGYGAITEKNQAGVAIGYESHSMRVGGKGWNPVTDQVWDDSEAQIEALGLKEKVKALDEEIAQKQALEQKAKKDLAEYPDDPGLIEKARVAHNETAKAKEKKNKLFATWKTPTGDVAVGNSDTGMTRQITGVAAGSEDTDAVNVAQLKALNRKNVTQLNALNSKVDTFDTKIENVKKIVDDNKIHYFAVGPDNEKNYTPEGNYNNDGVEQHGGIAIGFNASSKDGDGIAIGKSAQARGWQSIGIGEITYSIGDFSTSIGTRAQAFGERASAYGSLARAYGANGVAIGTGTLVASKKAITKAEFDLLSKEQKAWYNTDKVNQQEFYQYRGIDKDGEVKDIETNGTAVGNGAKSIGSGGTAVGHGASSIGTSGVAVGDHAKASDIDNVNGSDFGVAIGAYSQNKVAQGVALGASSVSDRAENILGYLPNKNGIIENLEEAMEAVGKGKEFTDLKNEYTQTQAQMNAAKVASDGNPGNPELKTKYEQAKQKFDALTTKYAIMTAPWTSRKGAVSIGNDKKGQTRQLIGVAAGSEDTDAVNVAQLKALNDKVDKASIHYFSVKSGKPAKLDGTNWSNDGATGEDAVAIGSKTKAQGKSSTALGTGAKAQGKSSTALGNAAKAEKESSTALGYRAIAKGESSTALGYSAKAQGKSSTALGYEAKAQGVSSTALGNAAKAEKESSTALGYRAIAKGVSSMALGHGAIAEKDYSTALGREAQALVDGSVALGEGTVAGRAAGKVGYVASAGDTTFDAVLTALGKKTDYDNWTATINPLKETYDNLTKAYFGAQSSREGVAAKDALDKWKGEHKEFLDALEEKSKLEATWRATKAAVSVGVDGVNKAGNRIIESRQITHVAAGSEDTDAVNVAQLKALNDKVDKGAIHYFSVNSSKPANPAGTNWSNDGATGKDAVAIGNGAIAKALDSTALGTGAQAEGLYSTALGYQAQAKGNDSTALGNGAIAKAQSSTALGYKAQAQGGSSTALGYEAQAEGLCSTALGQFAHAKGDDSTALGSSAKALGKISMALGQGAQAQGNFSMALGNAAQAQGLFSTALGQHAIAQGNDSTALGQGAQATVNGSVALGEGTVAGREAGKVGYVESAGGKTLDDVLTASGKKAYYNKLKETINKSKAEYESLKEACLVEDENEKADAEEQLETWKGEHKDFFDALEEKSKLEATWKATKAAVSVGGESVDEAGNKIIATRQITGVAAGSEDTDAVNVAQLKALNDKVDKGSVHYFSVKSTDQGTGSNWDNDGATGDGAVAIGNRAQAEGLYSTALGQYAQAKEDSSTALGNGAQALNAHATALGNGAQAEGLYSTALGYLSEAKGYSSAALGQFSEAQGQYSMALGYGAQAEGLYSMALGYGAEAQGDSSMALGQGAQAPVDGSVALGEGTVTGRKAGTVGYLASAGGTTFDAVLTALGKKTDYDNWTTTINPLKEEYDKLTQAYFDAGHSNNDAEKAELEAWKGQHANFIEALTAKEKLEATWKATKAAVSVGADGVNEAGNRIIESRQITNVAAGTQDTDAVNVAQLKALEKGSVHYFSVNSTDKGADSNWKNDGATGEDAVAIGIGTQAKGYASTAVGYEANVQGDNSTALGRKAQAQGGSSTALGDRAKAAADNGVAIGTRSEAQVDGSVALGEGTVAGREAGTVGYLVSAAGTTFDDVLTALGKKTEYYKWKATIDASIAEYHRLALEYFTAHGDSDKAVAKDKLDKWKVQHPEFVNALEEKSKLEATWKATKAAVSVGRDSPDQVGNRISRQITNVAAGTKDTDAVNVAQLKALNSKVTTNTGDITTLKKGWTLEDGNATKGTKTVKAEDTVKVTGDDYITATVDNDGLKLGMNVTKLNTQINNQIDSSETVKAKMNSWVLKAASDKDAEKAGKTINNTDNDVTFDVEAGQGLTVARDGATIKYGVNNKQLVGNINSGNTAVTNISAKFSVTDGTNTKAVNLGKDKNNNVKFLGTAGETTVTVGGNDDAPTVTVGLGAKFKKQVTDNTSNIAENKTAIGKNTTAISENKTAIGENKTA